MVNAYGVGVEDSAVSSAGCSVSGGGENKMSARGSVIAVGSEAVGAAGGVFD